MHNPKPATFNVVPDDPTGRTWALPEGAITRFGKGVCRSGPELDCIALSPDGTYFIAGTGMGLWFYDVKSMSPIALWETERGLISAVDISSDGKLIAIANWDGVVKVLDVQSGKCITQMKRYEESYTFSEFIAFSPDSKWVATGTGNGAIEVLDIQQGECIAQPEPDSRGENRNVTSQLAFSPNGEIIAATFTTPKNSGLGWVSVATTDPQTYLWNPETGKRIAKFPGGKFTFSPDSCLLAYASPNVNGLHRLVSVWNIKTQESVTCFREHNDKVDAIVFSPCGKFLASSDRGGTLRVWNLETADQKMEFTHYGVVSKRWLWKILYLLLKRIDADPSEIISSQVSPFYSQEGTLLAAVLNPLISTISRTHNIQVWDVKNRQKIQTIERKPYSIGAAWFSKCPRLSTEYVLLKDGKSSEDDETSTFSTLREQTCYPDIIAFSPDGQKLASINGDMEGIVVWDVESKQERETLKQDIRIHAMTFLSNGSLLSASIKGGKLKVWDVKKQKKTIAEFSTPGLASPVIFAPSGDKIATVRSQSSEKSIERTIYIFDLKSNEKFEIDTGHKNYIHAMTFSPDGKRISAACSNGGGQVFDTETGMEYAKFEDHREIREISHAPCGKYIAGGWEDEIQIWCAENFDLLQTMPQPKGSQKSYALAFSACSKYLASGTWWQKELEKMAIRLWNVATGENITTFWEHTSDIQSLAFSPDNTLLVSGGHDGTILLWDVKPYINSID